MTRHLAQNVGFLAGRPRARTLHCDLSTLMEVTMSRFARPLVSLALLALPGCYASGEVVATPELLVSAEISSVTLGEDCATTGIAEPGDCDGDGCGSWCAQTAVRLHLEADAVGETVPFEVLSVRLFDLTDGREVDALTTRTPQYFRDDRMMPWGETVAPGDVLDVTYPTDAPDWSSIGSESGGEHRTYGMRFRVLMRIRVSGVERTIEFEPAMREALIVT